MRFVLDESGEVRIGAFLESLAYDVKIVHRDYPAGLSDREILRLGRRENRIVITNDRDFGDLVFRDGEPHAGIIYLRFPLDSTADQKIASIQLLIETRPDDLGRFVVLTPRGIRVGDEAR